MLLQILGTWSLRLHVESNKTPRFLGGSLMGVMRESPMFMPICWFWLVLLWVVITISSVLSLFSFKRLLVILIFMSLIQASRQDIAVSFDTDIPGWKEIYNWVSSAWRWKFNPCFRIMFPRGVVYIVNKIGPSTEPWGTPYFNVTDVDVHDPIWTVCVRSLRYDSNHLRATPLFQKTDLIDSIISDGLWYQMQHLNQAVLKWPLPHCQRLWVDHFVHEGVLSLCCEVVCKQTEISHTSCWFSNALLIEHKQRVPQALKWKID